MGKNTMKTALLFAAMWGLVVAIGALISFGTRSSAPFYLSVVMGLGMNFYTYWNSDKLALRSMNARPVSPEEAPWMYQMVGELAERAGQPMPRLYLSPSMTPNAFATGRNPKNAAVCCTEGIIHLLNEREMRGVLGHELMHVYNRDILTSTLAAGMASVITAVAQIMSFGVMRGDNRQSNPLGLLGSLALIFLAPLAATILQMGISRSRELEADYDGAMLTEDPLALASALRKIEAGVKNNPLQRTPTRSNVAAMMIANPFRGALRSLMSTHPPMDQRIAQLEKLAGY
ncbi:zinc metalloprotease HtpX [Gleimia sp. 6138-11-ORH1]|uniref:zinc metalloprotease HtpX n=1 Tax=Gleimia sp. 6138-11-ORH1 TaxID=2973937 RepID=UPI0021682DD3|nr:zinc metalloprotease HtpX [Gleimia sp. 6138-11-ORH1]MCS4484647.1 zinc metalloprotease HtpX [Gleimia sp. 6138-11-ORH1]